MSTSVGNIIFGGPVDSNTETGKYNSLGEYMLQKLLEKGDAVVLVDGILDVQYTASELYRQVVRLAFCFQRLNVKEGDVVAICSESRFEFAIVLYATVCVNATLAPLNVTYSEAELNNAIQLSKPKVIFGSAQSIARVSSVLKEAKFIKNAFVFEDETTVRGIVPFKKLMTHKGILSAKDYFPRKTDTSTNVAFIACSSGTTGMPKGVEITQKNVMSYIDQHMILLLNSSFAGNVLCVIPWSHVYGLMRLLICCCAPTNLVFLPRFEERLFLKSIQKYKISIALMVPPLMVWLAKTDLLKEYDTSSLVALTCGAAPLPKSIEDTVKQRLGIRDIFQGYGLTETTGGIMFQTEKFNKPGSIGTIKPGNYAKVINPENGEILGPYLRGELCLKGDVIMKGYRNDKNSTNEILKTDGWLHTGDIVYYDGDFEFFIVDRIKELIKYKGLQVPPAEIEALLLTHPKIKDAAVIGKPDELAGELPFAVVVKEEGASLTEEDVCVYVAERTSPGKRLHGGVIFIKEIPKNPSGKILRRILRDKYLLRKSKL